MEKVVLLWEVRIGFGSARKFELKRGIPEEDPEPCSGVREKSDFGGNRDGEGEGRGSSNRLEDEPESGPSSWLAARD